MVEIIHNDLTYASDFKRLNMEWLEKYFSVCDTDLAILDHPDKIIADGGHVFFARYNGVVVGTCALIRYSETWWELVKMAVTEDVQGLGIGRKLIEACIATAHADGSTAIVLETAEALETAVHLYDKMGFVRFTLPHAHYTYNRPVFAMKMDL